MQYVHNHNVGKVKRLIFKVPQQKNTGDDDEMISSESLNLPDDIVDVKIGSSSSSSKAEEAENSPDDVQK